MTGSAAAARGSRSKTLALVVMLFAVAMTFIDLLARGARAARLGGRVGGRGSARAGGLTGTVPS